jgi:hypothetical protein
MTNIKNESAAARSGANGAMQSWDSRNVRFRARESKRAAVFPHTETSYAPPPERTLQ